MPEKTKIRRGSGAESRGRGVMRFTRGERRCGLQTHVILALAVAALFTVQSAVLVLSGGNFNLGMLLSFGIAGAGWAYAAFHRAVDAFCRHGVGLWLKGAFFAGLAFLAFMLCFVWQGGRAHTAQGDEQAIVILGAGLRGERPSGMLANRLDAALKQWRENPAALLVVTGGQGPDEALPEAEAMRRYLLEKGVPEENIVPEDKSTSTRENFAFAYRLLEERGLDMSRPVAFATSDFHCWRAARYAEMAGFAEVRAIPAQTGASRLIPSYLREVFGVLYFMVFRR